VVPLDSVASSPPGILAGNFFEYAGGYASVSELLPGKGYWVKASQAGTLTMNGVAGSAAGAADAGVLPPEGSAALTVTDSRGAAQRLYIGLPGTGMSTELPPPPPEGAFDARFDGNLSACSPGAGEEAALLLRGARYPVTISWTAAAEGMVLSVDGEIHRLAAPGSAVVAGEPGRIVVRHSTGEAPAAVPGTGWGLAGSYPNPFNPVTRIVFALPDGERARIAVYSALGEEVALLSDGARAAGGNSVDFDASDLPGGVYFCRMSWAGGSSTIKLLLMK
jgi:hypothetical protein